MLGRYKRKDRGYVHGSSSSVRKSLECGTMLLFIAVALISVKSEFTRIGAELDSPYYYVGCYTAQTDLLKETLHSNSPQDCVNNCKSQNYIYAIMSVELCFCSNSNAAADRHDDKFCNIPCQGITSTYCGGEGFHSFYSTMLAKEPVPNKLKIINATEHSLLVTWETSDSRKYKAEGDEDIAVTTERMRISNYLIRSSVVQSYSTLPFFPQPEFIVQSSENHFEITDLHPATTYNVTVEAICGSNVCGSTSLIGVTVIGEPSPPPEQPQLIESTNSTITINILPIRNDNGPVSKVLVIVERVDDALSQTFDATLLDYWQKAQDNGLSYYIAAELFYQPNDSKKSKVFVVGDAKLYGRYLNAPLENKEAHIHISLGVISSLNGVERRLYSRSSHDQHATVENFSYATFETGTESIIALTVTCVVFGTCLLLSLITYFYLRYKTCQVRSTINRLSNTHEMTLQQPIIERENNGFIVEEEVPVITGSCKQQLNKLLDVLPPLMRLPRNALRMNVNDVLADGCFGEVISGTLIHTLSTSPDASHSCQLHVIALDDLSNENQLKLLKEYSNLTRLEAHGSILEFYGVSASADWLYFLFEHQAVSLKRRLIESRRAPSTLPVQRITTLSEQLVLQWIYEMTTTLQYLADKKIVHQKLCSHNIFVTAEAKVKLSVFGPIPFVNNQKKVDISRWLAPEVLRHQHYSSKSDIWSLGCVAWECCNLGATPYPNITDSRDLLLAIKGGARPAQPSFVYDDLYQLFLNCWQLEPIDRISFEDIAFSVRQLMTSPRHAHCFDRASEPEGSTILDTLPFYLPMLEQCN